MFFSTFPTNARLNSERAVGIYMARNIQEIQPYMTSNTPGSDRRQNFLLDVPRLAHELQRYFFILFVVLWLAVPDSYDDSVFSLSEWTVRSRGQGFFSGFVY